jgi:hypothetical protein
MSFATRNATRLPTIPRLAMRNGKRSMLRGGVVSVKGQMPQGGAFKGVEYISNRRKIDVKRLTLLSIAVLFLATGTAQAQQFIGGSGAGIGRSQYAGSSIRFTPQEAACYRANYASTFAMQRCADQAHARVMRESRATPQGRCILAAAARPGLPSQQNAAVRRCLGR